MRAVRLATVLQVSNLGTHSLKGPLVMDTLSLRVGTDIPNRKDRLCFGPLRCGRPELDSEWSAAITTARR